MKCVVFPISILILLFTAGCPPTGTGKSSTLPAPATTDCAPAAAAAPPVAMPAPTLWAGQRLHKPTVSPGRGFLYLADAEATVYSVVIVDGGAVSARFDLDPNGLQDFVTHSAEDPGDGGAKTLSPVVKVSGPPRPLQFVVPAPPRPSSDDPAFWIRLACLADSAEGRAGVGSASSSK